MVICRVSFPGDIRHPPTPERCTPTTDGPGWPIPVDGGSPLWNVGAGADKFRHLQKRSRGPALSKSPARARLFEIIRRRSFGRGELMYASGRKSDFLSILKPPLL